MSARGGLIEPADFDETDAALTGLFADLLAVVSNADNEGER